MIGANTLVEDLGARVVKMHLVGIITMVLSCGAGAENKRPEAPTANSCLFLAVAALPNRPEFKVVSHKAEPYLTNIGGSPGSLPTNELGFMIVTINGAILDQPVTAIFQCYLPEPEENKVRTPKIFLYDLR